jgi:hypothetical protein
LFGRFGNLNDYRATIELLLVKGVDSLLGSLCCGKGNESITRRAGAPKDDLGREADEKKKMNKKETRLCRVATYMSLATGAKNAFSPSSVVE